MLKVEKLNKSYTNGVNTYPVLKDVSLHVNKGEFVAVMGPSGSGKTTLLNCISCFIPHDSGSIHLGDMDISSLDERRLAHVRNEKLGFVFQDFMLLDGLTVRENICLPQIIAKKPIAQMEAKSEKLCGLFGIKKLMDKYPAEISGGEKQRTAVARALMNNPYIILADEPTGNLDSRSCKAVIDAFLQAKEQIGATIFMVTHDSFAASFCDRVVVLKDGNIHQEVKKTGTRREFMDDLLDILRELGGDEDNKIYKKLRKNTKGQYYLLSFCVFLSVLLVTSFSLMYFGPTVQEFLPEGGDTRKMASLLLGVTAVGCFVFTVYASGLFFRFKAREYGILMALGTEKRQLKRLLFQELSVVTALSSLMGIFISVPASFLIWKLFELFIISNEQMTYRFGAVGFLPGILFACVLAWVLGIAGRRFINRSDIMEILRTQQKTEMVKEMKRWTFPVGIVLTILGILLGAGLPQIAARVFAIGLPGAVNLFYLLSLAGIYFILLSAVAQSRAKKNRSKYYKNLVSISLMRFTAKATTKNMCVMTLLIFVCGFSSFYGMQYVLAGGAVHTENSKDFSLHYPVLENQIGKEEIVHTASDYGIEVTDYTENTAVNLVVSYRAKDFDEETSRYIDVYRDKETAALFVSESDFEKLSGQDIMAAHGTYQTVTTTGYNGFFEYEDGLQEAMNPDTGKTYPLTYGGTVESDVLAPFSEPFAYVVCDEEYREMTEGVKEAYKETIISFNAVNVEDSYDFAKDLLAQYTDRATDLSNHMGYWDIWAQKRADEAEKRMGMGIKSI